jgi:hypothetical protein
LAWFGFAVTIPVSLLVVSFLYFFVVMSEEEMPTGSFLRVTLGKLIKK